MAPRPEFKRQEEEESRERGIRQDRVGELYNPGFVVVKVPAKGMPAGVLEDRLRASKQLLMLHFLFPEAQQRLQMRAVIVPILLDDAGEVERDEFLIVAIEMRIAEGATMVERELVLIRQELQGLGAHPRCGHNGFGRVKAPVAENCVDGPRHLLRRRHDCGIILSLGECIGGGSHRRFLAGYWSLRHKGPTGLPLPRHLRSLLPEASYPHPVDLLIRWNDGHSTFLATLQNRLI